MKDEKFDQKTQKLFEEIKETIDENRPECGAIHRRKKGD